VRDGVVLACCAGADEVGEASEEDADADLGFRGIWEVERLVFGGCAPGGDSGGVRHGLEWGERCFWVVCDVSVGVEVTFCLEARTGKTRWRR
jgi:hypothetical protein